MLGFDLADHVGARLEVGDVERLEHDVLAELGHLVAERGDALTARSEIGGDDLAAGACEVLADFGAETAYSAR